MISQLYQMLFPTCQPNNVMLFLISQTTLIFFKQFSFPLEDQKNKDYFHCSWNLILTATYTFSQKKTYEILLLILQLFYKI